ncbi:MAG TPA: tetratricopeptide repeat protein [Verrucomicrobiota bacterium]|nr:tetratricopeptide repeat protein [Verrucomicrobiota bacterium]
MQEKTVTQVPRQVRELYEKGKLALQRNNLEYAQMHFEQALKMEPAFYDCREALREVQFKRGGGSKNIFKKMFGAASVSSQIAKAQLSLKKNPVEAIEICEGILNEDPDNATAHRIIAEAAVAAEFPRTAILSLGILANKEPENKEIKLKLAELFAQIDQVDKAEAIFEELLQLYPNDAEISRAYKNLSARKTLVETGFEAVAQGKADYRDLIKDKEEAVALEQEQRAIKTDDVTQRLIEEYTERLQKEPNNLKLVRSLAELYAQKKNFDKSLEYYTILKNSELGNDPSLDKAIADTTLKKFDFLMEQLDKNAPDYEEKLSQLKAQKQTYQIEECKQRAERYPTDLSIKFELGVLYFNAGKINEAIAEFQKAQNNPQKRIASLNYLAQCFAKRGMYDSAIRMLQNAIKEKPVFDEEKKDLIYQLGCIYEKMNKKEQAIDQFKQIYEIDISYRDVAAKIDAYYASHQ